MTEHHAFTYDGRTVSVVLPASPDGYRLTWEGADGSGYPVDWTSAATYERHVESAREAADLLSTASYANIRNVTCTPAPLPIPAGTPLRDIDGFLSR